MIENIKNRIKKGVKRIDEYWKVINNKSECNHNDKESDVSQFWYVYNKKSPEYNPVKII